MPVPAGGASWPPTLAQLKLDMNVDADDTRDDDRLVQVLDAAVSYVEGARSGVDFAESDSTLEPLTDNLILGTLRLAGRWHNRRRSPDGMINAQELGATRVTSGDSDIDRLLGLGRYAGFVFA